MKLEYIVNINDENKTIKEILTTYLKVSHRLLITLKKENCIYLNDVQTFIYKTVKQNDKITVSLDYEEDNSNIIPKNIPLNIVYEDECYFIVDKTFGMPVHPSMDHYEDSLSNGIRFYFDKKRYKKENKTCK